MALSALPVSGSTSWYTWASDIHGRAQNSVLPVSALVYRDATNTIAIDRNGDIISSLATSAANNVTVIQAAIDAVDGVYTPGTSTTMGHGGGGTVQLSDQFFEVSSHIELKYGVSLVGSVGSFYRQGFSANAFSHQGTTIAPTSALPSIDIDTSGATVTRRPVLLVGRLNGGAGQNDSNPAGATVRDINIDARAATTAQCVVIADTQYTYMERLVLCDANGTGGRGIDVISTNPPDDGGFATTIDNCNIVNCTVGINVGGTGSTDSQIMNCRITQCKEASVWISNGGGGGGWQISGGHFTTGGTDMASGNQAHVIVDGSPTIISNVYFDTTGGWGVYMGATGCVVTGCYFKQAGANTKTAPIFMDGPGRKGIVTGCFVQGNANTKALVQIDTGGTQQERRMVITNNLLFQGTALAVGITCTSAGAAIAESDSAMNLALDGTANQYIWGNRILYTGGF